MGFHPSIGYTLPRTTGVDSRDWWVRSIHWNWPASEGLIHQSTLDFLLEGNLTSKFMERRSLAAHWWKSVIGGVDFNERWILLAVCVNLQLVRPISG